jgi:hypothetical protein
VSQDSLEDNLLLADKFKDEIGTVSWSWLRPHEKHKTLFLVASELDLIEVAIAVAEDKTVQVKAWLDRGDLVQPTLEQVAKWERAGGLFSGIIVKPYVFFKEAEA